MPRADHRGDCRRLHRRRRGHRRLLRPAAGREQRQIRLSRSRARSAIACRSPITAASPTLIGAARVKDLIFTARLIDAEEARIFGLVGEIVAPEALSARGEELAKTVAGHAPLTLRATKEALLRLRPPMETGEDLVVMCYRSADFQEGMEAFLAKRPPQWRGE